MRGGPLAGNNTIPFSTEFCPHTIEQMEACDDPSVNLIVIWAGIRDMKTTAAMNAIGRTVTDDPGGIFSVWPTQADRDKFSADDLTTMIETSLLEYFPERKSRDSGNTKEFKKFPGGSIRLPSAGSKTAFRGSTVKVLHMPEVDGWEDTESLYKAMGRTLGMADAIKIMESTGTIASEEGNGGEIIWHSVIAEHYDQSDQRKWFVECAECRELSIIYYPQIRADSGNLSEARWHCPRCDRGHTEAEWFRAAQGGLWLPTAGLSLDDLLFIRQSHRDAKAKRPEVRGYWRNGFNSLLPTAKGYATKLHEFLAEGEAAKRSTEKLKTWTNEIAAELWSLDRTGETPPPWTPIFERRENYGLTIPERALFLTSFTDCQLTRLECGWIAWGRNEESWIIDHTVLDGHVRDPEVWRLLRRELGRRFKHALGCEMALGFGFIDAGQYADDVYRFLQELARNPEPGVTGKVRASRGVGRHAHPVVDGVYKSISKNLSGHWIGTWEAKDRIYERLRMTPEPDDERHGIIHLNERITEEACRQMVSETVTVTIEKGVEVRKYENKKQVRNEWLDILVGNLAAMRLRPRAWDLLEADLRAQAAIATKQGKPPSAPHPARRRSSYVSGWR